MAEADIDRLAAQTLTNRRMLETLFAIVLKSHGVPPSDVPALADGMSAEIEAWSTDAEGLSPQTAALLREYMANDVQRFFVEVRRRLQLNPPEADMPR